VRLTAILKVLAVDASHALFELTLNVALVEVAVVNFTVTELPELEPTNDAPPVIDQLYEVAPVTAVTEYVTAVWLLQTETGPLIGPGTSGAAVT